MSRAKKYTMAPRRGVLALGGALLLFSAPAAWPLGLLEGFELALARDARYQAALAANLAGQEPLAQARAQLLPSISVNGARSKASADLQSGNDTAHNDYFSSSYSLQLRQPLYRKYNFAQYEQAKAQVTTADATLEKDREDLVQRFSTAYFDALLAQDQLALVLAQKAAYAAQLEGARRALAAGSGTRTDIDDAQARYDLTVAQELETRQNVDFTRRQVQVLVDRPVEGLAALDPGRLPLLPPDPERPEDWVALGEGSNPELRALQAKVEAARQEVEKARAGHYPTADLVALRSRAQSETITSINTQSLASQVGVQFNIPVFAGGYVNAAIRLAEANLEKSLQEYEARRREIGLDIRKEFQNVTEGIARVRALEQAERSAGQAVLSNQKGFQAGVRTRVDILNAEQQLVNTRRDLAQARYRYLLARIRLHSLSTASGRDAVAAVNAWLTTAR